MIKRLPLLFAAALALGCATSHPGSDTLRSVLLPLTAPWPDALPAEVAVRFEAESAGRRFIALGEGDHYVADKFPYRLAFLRELASSGVREIAMEMGPSDASRIDRYLETGEEDSLRRVVLFGFTGDSDREKRDLAFYTRLPEAQRRATVRYGDEEKRFFRALRALSEEARAGGGGRLRVFGFDLEATPAGGYEDARRRLESCAPDPAVTETLAELTQPIGISGLDEVRRLEEVAERIEVRAPALALACGSDSVARLGATVRILALSFRYFLERTAAEADHSLAGLTQLRDVFARREVVMEGRLVEHLATLPSDARVALLLHNLHAARESESLRFGPTSSLPLWKTIGSRLEERYPGQSTIVWLLYARGTRLDTTAPGGDADVRPRQGSLEDALETIPGPWAVFLRDVPQGSLFDSSVRFGTETAYGEGVLRGRFDMLVFLPRADAANHAVRGAAILLRS